MTNIKWKDSYRARCTATDAHQFFEKVREFNDGRLDLDDAVRRSEPKDAPIHNELEWDNAKCGDLYRRDQMRRVVRSLEVLHDNMAAPTRIYESVKVETLSEDPVSGQLRPQRTHVFRTTEDILSDPTMRADLLGQAVLDALRFRKRYAALAELSTLIRVIDEEVASLG